MRNQNTYKHWNSGEGSTFSLSFAKESFKKSGKKFKMLNSAYTELIYIRIYGSSRVQ